jgi:hypothetical protein
MNREDMPPWLALPAEVRQRIVKRYQELYGESTEDSLEASMEEGKVMLADLSKYRLVQHFGSIRKAMAFARKQDYPPGPHRLKDWKAACDRAAEQILLYADTGSREHILGERVNELVREELQRYQRLRKL